MLVYMLLNIIEERAYVGSTCKSVTERIKEHWSSAVEGSDAPIHRAIRSWPEDEWWTYVVLQNCYSEEELDAAETAWIAKCCTAETGIGYNVQTKAHRIKRKTNLTTVLAGKTPEEKKQFFSDCGKRGAQISGGNSLEAQAKREAKAQKKATFAAMTTMQRSEYFRECGRRGAERARLKRASS